jgi:hypothetical protein
MISGDPDEEKEGMISNPSSSNQGEIPEKAHYPKTAGQASRNGYKPIQGRIQT